MTITSKDTNKHLDHLINNLREKYTEEYYKANSDGTNKENITLSEYIRNKTRKAILDMAYNIG